MYGFFFFFSSRRRHTRFDCDWSSDVCSSDLPAHRELPVDQPAVEVHQADDLMVAVVAGGEPGVEQGRDRSEERRVGKSVDLGGRRIIKKKKNKKAIVNRDVR